MLFSGSAGIVQAMRTTTRSHRESRRGDREPNPDLRFDGSKPEMPTHRRAVGFVVMIALGLALLFSFRTPAHSAAAVGLAPAVSTAPAASAAPGGSAAPIAATAKGTGTFTGAVVPDPFGMVQVQVTLAGGKITNVTALQLPSQGRSGFISQTVAPILQGEAISAQSAIINLVSGATYTSQAYAQSLQSALDQARA
jgi:uncharacterized protein with FMN-binding domain